QFNEGFFPMMMMMSPQMMGQGSMLPYLMMYSGNDQARSIFPLLFMSRMFSGAGT
ncbi:hypothetical protein BgiMline_001558, partial [Biomphalaria glabrata]